MKVEGKKYCDTDKVKVSLINKNIAKDLIVKYHYTHYWSACRYAIGIYYEEDEEDILGNNDTLVGCAIYGFPVGQRHQHLFVTVLRKIMY